MNLRLLTLVLVSLVLTGCAQHVVPNKAEVAEIIQRQLIENQTTKEQPGRFDVRGLTNLQCSGNGTIATCQFDIDGNSFTQIFGHSKHGWTGRSSRYLGNS